MNKTEERAYRWLKIQGYQQVVYQHRNSPDFLTGDGKGFEAKKLRQNTIVFSKTQVENLRLHPNVSILVFNKSDDVIETIPFSELDPPCYWKTIRVALVDFHKYRPLKMRERTMVEIIHQKAMIGEEVKQLRFKLGYTQLQLAIAVGVSSGTVHRWENDKSRPSSMALVNLMVLSDRSLSELT